MLCAITVCVSHFAFVARGKKKPSHLLVYLAYLLSSPVHKKDLCFLTSVRSPA